MFYRADLLSRQGGKFYVIRILGGHCPQNAKKINKSDIRSVNIRQTCKDLMALIPTHIKSISLRLSAFLMCGVCEVLKLSVRHSIKMYSASLEELRRHKVRRTDDIDLTPKNVALLVQNLEAPMMTHDAGHLTFDADETTFNLHFDPRIAGGNVEDMSLNQIASWIGSVKSEMTFAIRLFRDCSMVELQRTVRRTGSHKRHRNHRCRDPSAGFSQKRH